MELPRTRENHPTILSPNNTILHSKQSKTREYAYHTDAPPQSTVDRSIILVYILHIAQQMKPINMRIELLFEYVAAISVLQPLVLYSHSTVLCVPMNYTTRYTSYHVWDDWLMLVQ